MTDPTAAIAAARAALVGVLMRDAYVVVRPTRVSDGGGGWTPGTPTTMSGIGVLEVTPRYLFEQGGPQVQQRGKYQLRVPVTDTQILPADVLTIGGRTLRVVFTPTTSANSLTRLIGLDEVSQ